ncbi:MAG: trypsin-like peptidase domain-containing protein [Cyanobacteria bacterium J06649_12]
MKSASVVRISSFGSKKSRRFGTGFLIGKTNRASYVLTCAHVVEDVGANGPLCVLNEHLQEGSTLVDARGMHASLVTTGIDKNIDLAILEVEDFLDNKPEILQLDQRPHPGCNVRILGFQKSEYLVSPRVLYGKLGDFVENSKDCEVKMNQGDYLQPGNSGSPVIDAETHLVLGVVSNREGEGERGRVILIQTLQLIYPVIGSTNLYKALGSIGYREQRTEFRRLIEKENTSAIVIHAKSGKYGQKWLIQKLIDRHRNRYPNTTMPTMVPVDLASFSRNWTSESLWKEVGRKFGVKRLDSQDQVIEKILRSIETKHIFIVLNNIGYWKEKEFLILLNDFWNPIVRQVKALDNRKHQLCMFLIDGRGEVHSWSKAFSKPDVVIEGSGQPILTPILEKFSAQELNDWIDHTLDIGLLPNSLHIESEIVVNRILSQSEDGLPDLVFEELCEKFLYSWREVLTQWIKF